jgi:hypothetical protein
MACNDDSAIVVTTEHAQKEEEEDPPIKKKVAKPLRFKPRSQASLHMTLFFGGETLCELPVNELEEWHSQVSERLHASGFYLQGNHLPISSTTSDGDFSFQVTGLTVFISSATKEFDSSDPGSRLGLAYAVWRPSRHGQGRVLVARACRDYEV